MATQEELDRQLAEELYQEEIRQFRISKEKTAYDLEEDRLLAEKLQREEEAEYAEFNKVEDFTPDLNGVNSDLPSGSKNIEHPFFSPGGAGKKVEIPSGARIRDNNLPSTSKHNKYETLHADHASLSLVDPIWEQIDPTPDIHALFIAFDNRFFWGMLKSCEVRWSPRMTLCAGLCCFQPRSRFCSIRLSKPLLALRPRSDLVETLLHEMIHALLFLTNNNRDRDGHGPEFHKHMYRINKEAGTKISVYHSFHDEVRHFKVHHWRCNGPCKDKPPYFGWVKRSMNRAPGKNDFWWADHERTCGGAYIKVSGPEKQIKEPKTKASEKARDSSPLLKYFKQDGDSSTPSRPGPSNVGGAKAGTSGFKPDLPGGSLFSGQSAVGTTKSGTAAKSGNRSNITSSFPETRPGTNPKSFPASRPPLGTSSQSARGGKTPASSAGRDTVGSQNRGTMNIPQHRPNIATLPRVRGGGGFGSRVFTIRGPAETRHVRPTSQTNARDGTSPATVRTTSPTESFKPFQGTGNILGRGTTPRQSGSTFRPRSSLVDLLSRANAKQKKAQQLLDIFSSDEEETEAKDEKPEALLKPKIEKESEKRMDFETKPGTEQKKSLKREFEAEASTSHRLAKLIKRETESGASSSRQGSDSHRAIVIPDHDVQVVCPVCSSKISASIINSHVDNCLN